MAEYSATEQTINPGESVIFSITDIPDVTGRIQHRGNSGSFMLAGRSGRRRRCCCCNRNFAQYLVSFGANIGLPEGGTPGSISMAIAIDGSTLIDTTMFSNPSAAETFDNVGRLTYVPIMNNCCQSLSVRNTSAVPITLTYGNLVINRAG